MFNTPSAWRLVDGRRVVVANGDDGERVKEIVKLVGLSIVAIEVQSTSVAVDPVFELSDGRRLEAFSTDTIEPWTFEFPPRKIYVASPSDEHAFDE
jgi:hypothetical protein